MLDFQNAVLTIKKQVAEKEGILEEEAEIESIWRRLKEGFWEFEISYSQGDDEGRSHKLWQKLYHLDIETGEIILEENISPEKTAPLTNEKIEI